MNFTKIIFSFLLIISSLPGHTMDRPADEKEYLDQFLNREFVPIEGLRMLLAKNMPNRDRMRCALARHLYSETLLGLVHKGNPLRDEVLRVFDLILWDGTGAASLLSAHPQSMEIFKMLLLENPRTDAISYYGTLLAVNASLSKGEIDILVDSLAASYGIFKQKNSLIEIMTVIGKIVNELNRYPENVKWAGDFGANTARNNYFLERFFEKIPCFFSDMSAMIEEKKNDNQLAATLSLCNRFLLMLQHTPKRWESTIGGMTQVLVSAAKVFKTAQSPDIHEHIINYFLFFSPIENEVRIGGKELKILVDDGKFRTFIMNIFKRKPDGTFPYPDIIYRKGVLIFGTWIDHMKRRSAASNRSLSKKAYPILRDLTEHHHEQVASLAKLYYKIIYDLGQK